MASPPRPTIWLAAGMRTPFAKVDDPPAGLDATELSMPEVQHMLNEVGGGLPDFMIWGTCADGGVGSVMLLESGPGTIIAPAP